MGLIGSSCIFHALDIKKTAEFYVSMLGFRSTEFLTCKEPHICLYKDNVEIILLRADNADVLPNRKLYGYGYDAYLYTDDGELLDKDLSEKGVNIVRHLNVTDYDNKELVVEDPDGRWIAFGIKIKD